MTTSTLPPDIFDQTTIISLSAVVVFLASAWALASCVVPASTPTSLRVLFVWHAFDVLIHSILEGSFVYHCLFSWIPDVAGSVGQGGREVGRDVFYPTAKGFIGTEGRIYGSQADATSPFAALWMVYARADWRWAGSDLVGSPKSMSLRERERGRERAGSSEFGMR